MPLFIVAEEVEAAVAELLACGSLKSEVAGEERKMRVLDAYCTRHLLVGGACNTHVVDVA